MSDLTILGNFPTYQMKSLRNLIVFSNYLHFERLPYSNMLMYLSGPSGY